MTYNTATILLFIAIIFCNSCLLAGAPHIPQIVMTHTQNSISENRLKTYSAIADISSWIGSCVTCGILCIAPISNPFTYCMICGCATCTCASYVIKQIINEILQAQTEEIKNSINQVKASDLSQYNNTKNK